jgi:PBP1b-binding outer membrane lipoprotein LpoB
MKKIIVSIVALAAMTVVSCSNKEAATEAESADSFKAKIENCTNPDSLSIYVEEAKAYAEKLVADGKLDEAKQFIATIEPTVKQYAPGLAGVLESATAAVDQLNSAVGSAADSIKSDAANAVDEAKAAVDAKAQEAVDAASAAVDAKAQEAKDAASAAVDAKAQEAKNAASSAIKGALGK